MAEPRRASVYAAPALSGAGAACSRGFGRPSEPIKQVETLSNVRRATDDLIDGSRTFLTQTAKPIAYLIATLVMIVVLAGCQSQSPRETYAAAEQALQIAADTTTAAVESGALTDRDILIAIKLALVEADQDLVRAHVLVKQDKPLDAQFYVDSAAGAARRVLSYLAAQAAAKESK